MAGRTATGLPLAGALPETDRYLEIEALFRLVLENSQPLIIDGIAVGKDQDSGKRYYDLRVKPWHDGAGETIGVISYWHDVTDQLKYERSLNESQQRFSRMAEGKGDGFWEWNHETGIIFWSRRCYEMFGIDHSRVIRPEDFFAHIHPEDLPAVKESIRNHFEKGGEYALEFRGFNETTGEYRWFTAHAKTLYGDDGKPKLTSGMRSDITDLVLARKALAESEERFRLTFELAGVGIANLTNDGRWLRVNNRVCEITGYSREELLGMTFQDITYAEDLNRNMALLGDLLSGRITSFNLEKRYQHKDGHLIWINTHVTAVKDESGAPLYCISAIEDISERKKYENHLIEESERKSQFLATLAHELRNPLAPIMNTMSILDMRDREIDAESKEYLIRVAKGSLDHLARLIDDLLDITRINRGKVKLEKEKFPIQDAIETAIRETGSLLNERNHGLIVNGKKEPILIYADKIRICQVFSNILNNAAKFTPKGGVIKISYRVEKDNVVTRIEDNGPGIPEDMLDKVFELFTQVENPYERSEAGLGIGLSLAREMVNLHGGKIKAANLKKGSQFTVRLPVC